jgi:hypothetical protein
MDFLAPTSWDHRAAQEFLTTGFASFRFPLFRGSWPCAGGHPCPFNRP